MIRVIVMLGLAVLSMSLFVAYYWWRLARASGSELTKNVSDSMTMGTGVPPSEDLGRLQALIRLRPLREKNEAPIVALSAYSFVLKVLSVSLLHLSKVSAAWVDRELRRCAHFFAVRLDQRIARVRKLWAEQMILPGKQKHPRRV